MYLFSDNFKLDDKNNKKFSKRPKYMYEEDDNTCIDLQQF